MELYYFGESEGRFTICVDQIDGGAKSVWLENLGMDLFLVNLEMTETLANRPVVL